MDRNTIIGLVLIVGILVTFTWLNKDSAEEERAKIEAQKEKNEADSLARKAELIDTSFVALTDSNGVIERDTNGNPINAVVPPDTTKIEPANVSTAIDTNLYKRAISLNPTLDTIKDKERIMQVYDSLYLDNENTRRKQEAAILLNSKYGIFSPAADESNETEYFTIENSRVKLRLSSKGGRITEAHVKGYVSYQDYKDSSSQANSIQLFDEDSSAQNLLLVPNNAKDFLNTKDLNFVVANPETDVTANSIRLRAKTTDPNKYLEFHYYLDSGSYVANYDVNFVGLRDEIDDNKMDFTWEMKGLSTEKLASQERTICGIMYKCQGDSRDYLNERGADIETEFASELEWIAFKHNYFTSMLFKEGEGFDKKYVELEVADQTSSNTYTDYYRADVSVATRVNENTTIPLRMYFGPNDYEELAALDMGAEQLINLGPSIFRVVNQYFIIPIFNLLENTGMGYGLIIVLMTLIIKLVILPLTYKNYKSSAKMRILRPEVEKINAKYPNKEDAVKKQQETMALYRKSGASPMAGCIPMLIQMPILFAAFRFFPSSIELRQHSFLWADDLSAYDSILSWSGDIPLITQFYGNHISLFTILMCVSTIFYTRLNSSQMNTSQPGMPNMKVIMYIFPVIMLFIFNSFAAGLSLYYLCGNLMNMGLMWVVKKYFIDEDKLQAKMAEKSKKPAKQSKFQQRLAEMAKQQQARQQQGRR